MPEESARPSPLRIEDLPIPDSRTEAYQMLLRAGPVVLIGDNTYAVTSADAVVDVLTQPLLFSSQGVASAALGSPVELVPVAVDPPRHTAIRRILKSHFSPRAMRPLAPAIERQAHELIDAFIDAGTCDAATDFAALFPTRVFLTWLGLPLEDLPQFVRWERVIAEGANPASTVPRHEVAEATREAQDHLKGIIEERKRRPGEASDLLSRLLADSGDDQLSDREILGLVHLFVLAGLGTVTSLLTCSFTRLAQDVALRRQIVDDPTVIPKAADELLRLDPPSPFLPRMATRDAIVAGHRIPAGSHVVVALGAASRDLDAADPDIADFHRGPEGTGRSLGFGWGDHRCLGAHLAQLEVRTALRVWHERIPDYELADGAAPRPKWPASAVRIDTVPLVFPRGGRTRQNLRHETFDRGEVCCARRALPT